MKKLTVLILMACSAIAVHAQQKQVLSAAASSCTATGSSCLIYNVDPNSGGATFTVTANTSSNTLQFEATGDGGTTWVPLNVTPSNSSTAVTSTTSTGTWQANVAGYIAVRIRMSTLVSGTSTVSIITSTASARAGGGGGGLAPNSPGIAPNIALVTISPNCLTGAPNCYTVADDVQIVSDATWSATATVQVTLGGTDPPFRCPGGVYPCSSCPGATTSATCDVGKTAFGTVNCAAINPYECVGSIPQGTISSITSATVATLTSTATTASNNGSGFHYFAWGTIDTTPMEQAADFAYQAKTPIAVQYPCGNMFFDNSIMSPVRVTRYNFTPIVFKGCGQGQTQLVPLPNFTCGDTTGCYIHIYNGTGQHVGETGWADYAEGFSIFGLGQDLPQTGQFTGSSYNLVDCDLYTHCKDIYLLGTFWDFANTKTVYGFSCNQADLCDNDVAWVAGNYGLFAAPTIQGTTNVVGGYYGNTHFSSCVIGGTGSVSGSGNVAFHGVICGFSLTTGSSTSAEAALNIPSGVTTNFTDYGSSFWSTMFFSGGNAELFGSTEYPDSGGSSAALYVNNSAATLNLHSFYYRVAAGTFPWLNLSAGTVNFHCGQVGRYDGTNAATITGGSLFVDPCPVGADTQLAKAAAQTAKTLFTTLSSTAFYRVHLSVECTTTSSAATVTPAILYTDTSNTVQTVTGTAATCTTLGAASNTSQDVTFRAKNATNIQYQTTIANTPTYDVSVTVEQLSLN